MSIIFRFFIASSLIFTFLCHANQKTMDQPGQEVIGENVDFSIPENSSKWRPPIFSEDSSILGHIFRIEEGHFEKDIPQNRQYILAAVSSFDNRVAVSAYGMEIYFKVMPDGTQAWAYVRNGIIKNGGYNRHPQKWVSNPRMAAGGEITCIKYAKGEPNETDLKIRLVFNRIIDAYNSSQPLRPLNTKDITYKPSNHTLGKGVENQTGLIVNLFDENSDSEPKEHIFFLPTPDGLFLSEEEIQRILSELATGIFYYDTVPFFSLHFNDDLVQYSVIHPAYQNTFIGHVMSMLDHYMKGFINGFYFEESFAKSWETNPKKDEKFLKNNRKDLQKYCQEKLNISYQTFKQIYKELENELPDTRYIDYDLCTRSFRIIAKQESINRADNLFLLNGDFDVFYSLKSKGISSIQHQLEEKACQKMCEQIKTIMPQIPMFKKYFQALSLINFLNYHYLTLKKNDKVPDLKPKTFLKNLVECPSIFPPYPNENTSNDRLETALTSLLDSLGKKDKQRVLTAIRSEQNEKEAVTIIAKALYDLAYSRLPRKDPFLTSFDWNQAANDLIKICKKADKEVAEGIDASLVMIGLKQQQEPMTSKMLQLLLAKFDTAIKQVSELINDTQAEIQENQKHDLPCLEQFTELTELNRLKQGYVSDREMCELWSQGSLLPTVGKMIVFLDVARHRMTMHPEKTKGMLHVAGGCGLHLVDKSAESDPLGYTLIERHREKLASLPYETLLSIKNAPVSGVFFKVAYENFSITNEEERMESLGYYCIPHAKYRLNDAQTYALDAISCQDEDRFKKYAAQIKQWNFQDPLGVSVLHYASNEKNPFFLNYILNQYNIDLTNGDAYKYTALHHAARRGHFENVKKLVQKAPKLIDSLARNGETPLYLAAQNNHLECIRFLLKNGANPNLKTTMGINPLMAAIFLGHVEAASELLEHSIIDLENWLNDGTSVFHIATEAGLEKVVERLCQAGCDARRVRSDGFNPLHIAAENGWLEGINLIINHCYYINLDAKTKMGDTALQLAENAGHFEVANLLRQCGAKQ